MFRLLLFAVGAGLLGAVIGAFAIYILAGGLPEGAIMGAILGGSAGVILAARLDARQSENILASSDPASARRSAALLSARRQQIRQFDRDRTAAASTGQFMSKLDEYAVDSDRARAEKNKETGQ